MSQHWKVKVFKLNLALKNTLLFYSLSQLFVVDVRFLAAAQLVGAVMAAGVMMGWAGKQQLPEHFVSRWFQQTAVVLGILKWRCQTRCMLWRHGGMSVQSLSLWSAGAQGATGMLTTLELWLYTQRMPRNSSLNSLAKRPSVSVIHTVNF